LLTRILAPLDDAEVRDSGVGDGSYTIRGHAAVFNRLSLDLGGFREKIDPGAFTNVLDRKPDVLAVWDHDTRYTLARTLNGTLELREDPLGLHNWMRVAPTSYASDLRVLMERGDIDQASFMFTIAQERAEWSGNENDPVVFTIEEVGDLYDVTVTGRGAYPQTTQNVVQSSLGARLAKVIREDRAGGLTLDDARSAGLITEASSRELAELGLEGSAEAAPGSPAAEEAVATGGNSRKRREAVARAEAALAIARQK